MIAFAFDATNRVCFEEGLEKERADAERHAQVNAVLLLVANKIDLPDRQVSSQEGEAYAAKHNMLYLEFSAKDGDKNVLLSKLQEAADKYLVDE